MQESSRTKEQGLAKSYYKTRQKFGTIIQVHEKLNAVKVRIDGAGLANGGNFIPITNPWQQLIHDFGPLRNSLRVVINYEGDQENFASATVIGLEGEPPAGQQERADVSLSLYEIFTPGSF